MTDFRNLKPNTELVCGNSRFTFICLDADDMVTLKDIEGCNIPRVLTLAEARRENFSVVAEIDDAVHLSDHEESILDELTDKDRHLTLQRLAVVNVGMNFLASNPDASQNEAAEYATRHGNELIRRRLHPNQRKSGFQNSKDLFSFSSVVKYLSDYRTSGLAGIVSDEDHSAQTQINPRSENAFLVKHAQPMVDDYQSNRKLTKKPLWKAFCGIILRTYGTSNPPGMISQRTFERWLDGLPARDTIKGREGKSAANDALDPVVRQERPLRAWEEVEGDCWTGDLFVVDDPLSMAAGRNTLKPVRPTFVLMIDRATGAIVAWSINIGKPSSAMVVRTYVDAMKDRSAACLAAGAVTKPIKPAGIGKIITDCGKEFIADNTVQAAIHLKMEIQTGVAGVPKLRGKVEGLNSIIMNDFISFFIEQTGNKPGQSASYANDKLFPIPIAELRRYFCRWVEDVYNNEPAMGSHGRSRRQQVEYLRDREGALPLPSESAMHSARMLRFERKNSKLGINYERQTFHAPVLDDLRDDEGIKKVACRIDPDDIGQIEAHIHGKWQIIPNTDARFRGVALEHWRSGNLMFEMAGKKSSAVTYETRVEATLTLRDKMAAIIATGISIAPFDFSTEVRAMMDNTETEKSEKSTPKTKSEEGIVDDNLSKNLGLGRGMDMSEYGEE